MYETERYLRECVDSLLDQNLADIEVVLVDDGSPDACGDIAEEYALADVRVKVVHQVNGGLGPARNAGVACATGEYVGFVDSDDYVLPDMYERLYEVASRTGADIVVSGHCDMRDGVAVKVKPHPLAGVVASGDELEATRLRLYGHGPEDADIEAFPMSVCMSLYRREMVVGGCLAFKEILSEDTFFNLDAYAAAERVAFTGDTGYCYRKEGQASITKTFSPAKLDRFRTFMRELVLMADQEGSAECSHRARRMTIDYSRLYVGMVEDSGLSLREKREQVRRLLVTNEFRDFCSSFPLGELFVQQRVFQFFLDKGMVGCALLLCRLRRMKG